MEVARVVVGVDVGKREHYAWAEKRETGEILFRGRLANTEADVARTLAKAGDPKDAIVVVDQPSNIGATVLRVASHLGFSVAYLPSEAMRREAQRQAVTSKTDRSDAMVICRAAIEAPRLLRPALQDATKSRVRVLRARDADLMHDETKATNRLKAALVELMPELEAALDGERLRSGAALELLSKFGGPWGMRAHRKAVANFLAKRGKKAPAGLSEAIDAALRCASIEPEGAREVEDALVGACARDLARIIAERAELDRRILTLLAKDRDFNNLLTMPGVGVKTAASIVADVDIKRFDDAFKLGRYMGLAPRVAKSGSSIDRTWSDRRGNARLRHAMFCSAFCALRHDARSYAFYCRKRREGKTFAAAVLALARKRVKVIYAMLRDGVPYKKREWSPGPVSVS